MISPISHKMADSDDETTISTISTETRTRPEFVSSGTSAPAVKRRKTNAIVSIKPHTIYGVVDNDNNIIYIGSTTNEKIRSASVEGGAPMLRVWIQSMITEDPEWKLGDHIKILARNVPADRVLAFKTMLKSDHKTFWSEGNGRCNMHAQNVADIEHEFPKMRQELEDGFVTNTITPLQAAETDQSILADIDAETRDENGSIPCVQNALIVQNELVQALQGSNFERMTTALMGEYHREKLGRFEKVDLDDLNRKLNHLKEENEHHPRHEDNQVEASLHDSALSMLRRLVGVTHADATNSTDITYSYVYEHLKALAAVIRHRDNINSRSFQSQMAWTQPSFKHKGNQIPQGYDEAIRHANESLNNPQYRDATEWQKTQMKARLASIEQMKRNNEPIRSCPLPKH